MLTVEIKVNGALIGHIYLVNMGAVLGVPDKNRYEYEFYEIGAQLDSEQKKKRLSKYKPLRTGKLVHKRTDGAMRLIKKAIDDIHKTS